MRKLIFAAFVCLLFSAFSSAAFGQNAQRISFAKGHTSATASGTLKSYRSKRHFVIKVRAGQTLTTERVSGGAISIWIKGPDGEDAGGDLDLSCHDRREVTPTVAGDYILEVVECQKADPWHGSFRFRVRVR